MSRGIDVNPYAVFDIEVPAKDGNRKHDRLQCQHCDYKLQRKANRCIVHTIRCPNTPIELKVKLGFVNEEDIEVGVDGLPKLKEALPLPKSNLSRKRRIRTKGWSDMESNVTDDESVSGKLPKGKARKTEAITVFSDFLENLGMDTTRARKKFVDYTDADFEREEKELRIRKMRAEVKQIEAQAKMYEAKEEYYSRMPHLEERKIKLMDGLLQVAQNYIYQNETSITVLKSETMAEIRNDSCTENLGQEMSNHSSI